MTDAPTFGARMVGLLLAAGIALAGLFAVLTAYAPDLGNGQDGGAHALSNAAIGFSGIVRLAQATGTATSLSRDARNLPARGLLVLTPGPTTPPADVAALITARNAQPGATPILLVLPKWKTSPKFGGRGWVEQSGVLPEPDLADATRTVAPYFVVDIKPLPPCCLTADKDDGIAFPVPDHLRGLEVPTGAKTKLQTVLWDNRDNAVIAWLPDKDVYILAEPDLLNNHALRDPATARAALALLAKLADGGPIAFDLTLNGFGRSRNIARLAFEPPFLALTLVLCAAAALAGLQAAIRFGSPRATPRALAFGKRALVDNAAELIRSARREPAMAARYARLMLDDAAAVRGAPPGLSPSALGKWLDRRATASPAFDTLDTAANDARTRDDGLAAARALYAWKEDVAHDR